MNEPAPLKISVHKDGRPILEQSFQRSVIKLGRLGSAHIRLEDPAVSRIHAVLEASKDGFNLIDMGSAEGTLVNGERVSKKRVAPGDVLRVGPYEIRLEGAAVSRQPPPPPPDTSDVVDNSPSSPAAASSVSLKAATAVRTPDQSRAAALSEAVMLGTASWGAEGPKTPGWGTPPSVPADLPDFAPAEAGRPVESPDSAPVSSSSPAGAPPPAPRASSWGAVPNNLASSQVPEDQRSLEVKVVWNDDTVLETLAVDDAAEVSMGDERKVTGWGPFRKIHRCDVEIPSKGMFAPSFVFARSASKSGAVYELQWPKNWPGRIERADGTVLDSTDVVNASDDAPQLTRYLLQPEEMVTVYHGDLKVQARYVRNVKVAPLPWSDALNYAWLNTFLLAFFFHVVAVFSFLNTPKTQEDLTEDLHKAVHRFAQFKLEQEKKKPESLLNELKRGEKTAKAKGNEGRAGAEKKKQRPDRRAASKGKPNDKELAQMTLDKLFGAKGDSAVSSLFGGSGLGGEVNEALGGLSGAKVGDQGGLGGLGTRGSGPGGGGLDMASVGLGALGTRGKGGGGSGDYGRSAGRLGKKKKRDIEISPGNVLVMGSLPKDIIRRIIKQHLAQIRYCYEKELVRTPGMFGKVATQFTISGQGRVIDAKVTRSTLGNRVVEGCVTQKIRTWKFPKPKGGGIVIVNYPFVFNTSG